MKGVTPVKLRRACTEGACPRGAPLHLVPTKERRHIFRPPTAAAQPQVRGDGQATHYLLHEGFSVKEVQRILRRNPRLDSIDVATHIRPLYGCLTAIGLHAREIQEMLVKCPELLCFHVTNKVEPVISFLHDLGLSEIELRLAIKRFPHMLDYGVKSHLRPQLAYLKSLGVEEQEIRRMVCKRPHILGAGIEPLVKYLMRIGVKRTEVYTLIQTYPFDYTIPVKDCFEDP